IILQFARKPFLGTAFQLPDENGIFKYCLRDSAQEHVQIPVLHAQKFPVRLTDQTGIPSVLQKTALQAEDLAAALNPEFPSVIPVKIPRLIAAVGIRRCRPAAFSPDPEEHAAQKRMKRCLAAAVFSCDHIDAVRTVN